MPIDATQATFATAGIAGPDAPPVALDSGTNPNGYLYIGSARYWLCATLQQDSAVPKTRPDIEWRTGSNLALAVAYVKSFAAHAAWTFATDASGATPTSTYPSIAALVE